MTLSVYWVAGSIVLPFSLKPQDQVCFIINKGQKLLVATDFAGVSIQPTFRLFCNELGDAAGWNAPD